MLPGEIKIWCIELLTLSREIQIFSTFCLLLGQHIFLWYDEIRQAFFTGVKNPKKSFKKLTATLPQLHCPTPSYGYHSPRNIRWKSVNHAESGIAVLLEPSADAFADGLVWHHGRWQQQLSITRVAGRPLGYVLSGKVERPRTAAVVVAIGAMSHVTPGQVFQLGVPRLEEGGHKWDKKSPFFSKLA